MDGTQKYTNSFDIFMRGQEVLSGGQRIHDPDQLAKNLGISGIDPDDLKDYMNAFRWGMEPHAGGGIGTLLLSYLEWKLLLTGSKGLERVVMLYLNLGNIRWASLFPRDPKVSLRSLVRYRYILLTLVVSRFPQSSGRWS